MKTACRIPIKLFSRMTAGFFCLMICIPSLASAQCPPKGSTESGLQALKKSEFQISDDNQRQSLALGLLPCLALPNPILRDGIAFEALSFWLRKDQLSLPTRQALLENLQSNMTSTQPDKQGFKAPFSVLVLSEVARTDRIKAWMSGEQRNKLVIETSHYLAGIRDYRGFDDKQGWRHAVAHSSDLAMQLALNPALDKNQLDLLLNASTQQIAPTAHSYIHGESERLLRSVLYIAKRDLHDEKEWQVWMEKLVQPAPLAKWDDAFSSSAGLAKRHNLQAFLLLLHTNTLQSDNKSWQILNRLSLEALKKLP
ncbi:MAG: DUF2785 domain-containing protein [Arenimonas sp.]